MPKLGRMRTLRSLAALVVIVAVLSPVAVADGEKLDLFVGDPAAVDAAIEKYRDGHPLVVNFWATWCKPCIYELPLLEKLHTEYAKKGVRFYAVSLDSFVFEEAEARERIAAMVKEHGLTYPGAYVAGDLDAANEAWKLGGVIPATLFLDASGKEDKRVMGLLEESEARAELDKLAR